MNASEAGVRLTLVEELSRKWHKHHNTVVLDGGFVAGMMRGYAESIRLVLGANELSAIERSLERGEL